MTVKYQTFLTAKDGGTVEIVGDESAIDEIERALVSAGFHFNDDAKCWHNGFYGYEGPEPTVRNEIV